MRERHRPPIRVALGRALSLKLLLIQVDWALVRDTSQQMKLSLGRGSDIALSISHEIGREISANCEEPSGS
jgi:hypothetical protein